MVAVLPLVDSSDNVTIVSYAASTGAIRRRVQEGEGEPHTSLLIDYSVIFVVNSTDYDTIVTAYLQCHTLLTYSVESGTFTAHMRSNFAATEGVATTSPQLLTAASSELSIGDFSYVLVQVVSAPTSMPSLGPEEAKSADATFLDMGGLPLYGTYFITLCYQS